MHKRVNKNSKTLEGQGTTSLANNSSTINPNDLTSLPEGDSEVTKSHPEGDDDIKFSIDGFHK